MCVCVCVFSVEKRSRLMYFSKLNRALFFTLLAMVIILIEHFFISSIVYQFLYCLASDVFVGHPFLILTFSGFIGALTGYSGWMGLCEKVWLHYNGTSSRIGYPWHFLTRDILQFDVDISSGTLVHETASLFHLRSPSWFKFTKQALPSVVS